MMPKELRKIILNRDELAQGVVSYNRMLQEPVFSGEIRSIQLGEEGRCALEVHNTVGGNRVKGTVELGSDFLLECLIRFCLENNIPIPRKSRRTVETGEGTITLVIEIDEYSI